MRSVTLIVSVAFCVCAGAFGDWVDWRGATQEGITDAAGLPLHWSETENVAWKTPIHDLGYSTPVVKGGQAWLTTATQDGAGLYAVCVDVKSGKIVRDIPVFTIEKPQRIHPNNSYATPSAVIEAGRVYVHFGSAGTACIDTASGEVLWRRTDLNCEHMQGPASSPVLFENLVIVTLEGTDKQFMAALDKKTGDTVWRYDRPADIYTGHEGVFMKSYQTPVFVQVDGKTQLVSNGALMCTGHDPLTGKELWRVRYQDDSTISRIVTGQGLMFVNTGGNPGKTQLYAVREGGVGDITDTHVAWKMLKDAPHESSPVVVGDLLYTMNEHGLMICTEAATGTQVWSQKMKGEFWASFLATKDRIYLSNKKGETTVFAPGREYKELAVNTLDGEFWASPAVAGNALLLRSKTHLYRIEGGK
jgi:outer membrane protein assembly factor BamB